MSLEVETGSGSGSAESYASVADADAHHSARINTLWASLLTEEKEGALRRATDYMEQTYRTLWDGVKTRSAQALSWPRANVPVEGAPGYFWAIDAVPEVVKRACIELAFRAAGGELEEDVEALRKSSVRVGPITVNYSDRSPGAKSYPAIDAWLSQFFATGGSTRYSAGVTR